MTVAPQTHADWLAQREEHRAVIAGLLGDLPPLFTPTPTVTTVEQFDGYTRESFQFHNGTDDTVYGYLLIPNGLTGPAPAIFYQHAHGGNYGRGKNELYSESPMKTPPAPDLMAAGYVVMAIDCYAFGERMTHGPAETGESGREVETAWFKKHLWEGRTLWGMIVRDDRLALNYLLARPEVDTSRVVATGMSLGGSRATWLAALDERIAAVIPVAQMTRYTDFAAAGNYNLHSVYYYVPNALRSGRDMEILTALVAPRPQRILIGDADPLSPLVGVQKIDAFTQQVYALYGASERFETRYYAGVAHAYTPEMYADMLALLKQDT